jgi:methionyl-tRNA formyltransferase
VSPFPWAFLGTPDAAVPSLRALAAAGAPPSLVVTPAAKRRGRGPAPSPCPVAAAAAVLGIDVLETEDVNRPASLSALHARRPELLVVVAFGQILRREVRSLPRLGCLNLHFSLLPRWRGAAPVQRAVEAGDGTTGVTVQRIVARLDAGPVVARRPVEIGDDERAGELEARLADVGAALLADVVLHARDTGSLIEGKPQDESLATRAPKVAKTEGAADFRWSPEEFCRRARALHPWPLLHAEARNAGRRAAPVAIHRAAVGRTRGLGGDPGLVVAAGKDGIEVACGAGSVRLLEVQRPGGKVLDAAAFLNGFPLKPGDRLG